MPDSTVETTTITIDKMCLIKSHILIYKLNKVILKGLKWQKARWYLRLIKNVCIIILIIIIGEILHQIKL